jgi:hypothetical protein
VSEQEPPPPLPRVKARLPFTQRPGARGAGAMRPASLAIYTVLALGLAGLALYMGAIARHPLTSAYVIAPAVGAAWFGLRLFMTLAPKG